MNIDNKKIVFILFLSIQSISFAQMFDYLEHSKDMTINNLSITEQINSSFDELEIKFKGLTLWELEQFKRVFIEIKKEIVDLPENKVLEIKHDKFAELYLLISESEMELDFEYLEMIDKLNSQAVKEKINYEFKPLRKVEGRIHKIIINELMTDESEMNKIKDNISTSVDIVMLPFKGLFFIEVAIQGSIDIGGDKIINEIINNYSKYFALGFFTDNREIYLEEISEVVN
ncbi:hypothetical protein QWY81_11640 [Polaribacter undariae]|uniref:Uncharacterized protein n=1 Tax=Polaribacter sejongensis TaxID=985043 RepID=A0AAJ1QXU5_9FLAO|nr:hypothetical protein [Polaribacter undariae]MDN3620107.1 hypothetical protein [Polaribacter undariae]UWD32510.1 hypothetical protein NQP51_02290 [Polaribacter undariae]